MGLLHRQSRRAFIRSTAMLSGAMLSQPLLSAAAKGQKTVLSGHLWVYASRFPPDWDCTPILDEVFSELSSAGLQGVELMESVLRRDDAVPRLKALVSKYTLPVTGTSYYADMWDASQRQRILEDMEIVVMRLAKLKAAHIGLSVGDAGRRKTDHELDAQAQVLGDVLDICKRHGVQPNMHNHTVELMDDGRDLKEMIRRVPDLKLGPDINWLIRAGVDPVAFIYEHGHKITYLHLRDQDSTGRWTEAVGDGVTDFPAIANALREVGFTGDAAIELAFEGTPTAPVKTSWARSRRYVKSIFNW
ncbi:sugar phosphate isomerase/epimerase [Parapedobacter sp. ISTM3]|uniref:sugar phosphate isomerase/epimerase family protein n=1 Tax=Parapedobacter sp. ISTM3 TaxID=2800130 RepID=UPI0019087CD2|nr:sugar phosphate isomerase/epimerase family protein [Parapedobacter sp. ISTM3]MBK1441211.1 sugar phosphate isomerase/epimerase [Parapedobacter sp. ISTM3]